MTVSGSSDRWGLPAPPSDVSSLRLTVVSDVTLRVSDSPSTVHWFESHASPGRAVTDDDPGEKTTSIQI